MATRLRARIFAAIGLGTGLLALAGCGSSSGGGTSLGDMFLSAGLTPPPVQQAATADTFCPSVAVIEGGAAIQAYAGGQVGRPEALRSQVTLGQIARECALQPDGSVLVKVGVEGRALQGAGGAAGRFDVPVHIVVKKGSTVLADRVRRTAVAIPAGDTQGAFAIVEDGIVVPPTAAQDFEIEVGLGGSSSTEKPRRRRG